MTVTEILMRGHALRVVVRLRSPLVHGAFGPPVGNATLVRRLPIASLPGMPIVPVYSGSGLRGVMRRLVMRELFASTGLSRDSVPGHAWDRLYAALANGGHLEGSETTVDPTRIRALRQALPPLSLFGAALYTWMMPGHMDVGWLWPRCRETVEAKLVSAGDDAMAEDLVDEVSFARHVDRDEQDPEVSGVTPMPTTYETIRTGATLEGVVELTREAVPVEESCVAHALSMVTHLGAKASAGMGSVEIEHDGDPTGYREWLDSSRDVARETLLGLADQMGRRSGKGVRGKPASDEGQDR